MDASYRSTVDGNVYECIAKMDRRESNDPISACLLMTASTSICVHVHISPSISDWTGSVRAIKSESSWRQGGRGKGRRRRSYERSKR